MNCERSDNTSLEYGREAPPLGRQRRSPSVPSLRTKVDRIPLPWVLERLTIAAPAPSPNSTHVERSCQSVIALSFSTPMTSAVSALPDAIIPSATVQLWMKPEH